MANTYTIYFHSAFWPYTEGVKSCSVTADSYFNLITNCMNLFPKLRKAIQKLARQPGQEVWIALDRRILKDGELFLPPSKSKKITLIPIIFGNGRIIGVIFAVALIVASFVISGGSSLAAAASASASAGASFGGAVGGFFGGFSLSGLLLKAGINILLSSVLGMLFKPPKPSSPDGAANRDNDLFSDLQNTTSVMTPVSLIYGNIRVPGQFISGYVKTINHDKTAEIKVSDYI